MGGTSSKHGEVRNSYKTFFGKYQAYMGERYKIDIKEIRRGLVNWIQLTRDRVQWWTFVSTAMKLLLP